jgi:hypothetical protein
MSERVQIWLLVALAGGLAAKLLWALSVAMQGG